jgi:serine/threonine protein kinase
MPVDGAAVLDGRYALEQVIGSGGMAEVYRATDQLLSRSVAVKMLRDVAASEPDRQRFAAEARTLARLSHPGLVTILDAGSAGERPYLVMELIDGPSLAAVSVGTPIDAVQAASIGAQVADALAYVHAVGVVHRDVKPANILMGADGNVWLGDFGIARLVADTAHPTSTGLIIGTASYLAPEQLRGEDVTPAVDVYALGLVLIEAVTGAPAYPGSGLESAMARLSRPPAVPEELPSDWQALLRSMTAVDPSARPSALDVALALDGISGSSLEQPPPGGPVETQVLAAPVAAPRSHHRLAWLGAVVAAAIVAVGAIVALGADDGGGGAAHRVETPTDVSPRLQEPLQDLHDALNGEGQ